MIVVKNGFTMQEHAPITYNYRYQSIPSPVSRTNIFPLIQNDPPDVLPAAITDTGYPVYLASQMAVGTIGGNTSIDGYLSYRSSQGANKHIQVTSESLGALYGYDISFSYDDGYAYTGEQIGSEVPMIFAFITEEIAFYTWTGTHALEYSAPDFKIAYQYVKNGVPRIGVTKFFGRSTQRRYNSLRLAQTGQHTQQDLVYTVTGGVVTP